MDGSSECENVKCSRPVDIPVGGAVLLRKADEEGFWPKC